MYYRTEDSDIALSYKGVNIYHVYKNDYEADGRRTYWFGTDAGVTESLPPEDPLGAFDVRESRAESIPLGTRKLAEKYVYNDGITIEDNLKRLIDLGGIDLNDDEEVVFPYPEEESDDGYFPFGEWDEVRSAPEEKIQVDPFVVTKIDRENHYCWGFRSGDGRPVQGGLNYVRTGRRIEDVIRDCLERNTGSSDKKGVIRDVTAIERDGLDIRTVTVSFRVPDENFDLMEAIRKAVAEFAETDDGKAALEYTCGYFNLEDVVCFLPDCICERHGFTIEGSLDHNDEIDWNFNFTDYVKKENET